MKKFAAFAFVALFLAVGAFATIAYATHSWGGYHWARTVNPFTLKLSDNVSSTWDAYLGTTSIDWSVSDVLNTTIIPGKSNASCKATKGRVEVCNRTYGNNGWLGVAQIWISGSHITQGTVKVNDTYFKTAKYNTPAWRNTVMCQEVGHTLGLDHQDEAFNNSNLGTCMDYTNDPDGALYGQLSNEHPNAHDYEELALIYAHLDATTTVGQTISNGQAKVNLEEPGQWGKAIKESRDGRNSLYERDFGNGDKVFTFVIWAD